MQRNAVNDRFCQSDSFLHRVGAYSSMGERASGPLALQTYVGFYPAIRLARWVAPVALDPCEESCRHPVGRCLSYGAAAHVPVQARPVRHGLLAQHTWMRREGL
jgi:hypothetical protein